MRTTFDPALAHLREVAFHLSRRAEIMPFRVRFERAVGDALDEELAVAFEEEFGDRADRARGSGAHSGSSDSLSRCGDAKIFTPSLLE